MPGPQPVAADRPSRSIVWWLLVVVALGAGGLAAWAHFWPLTTSLAGEPIECGSLAQRRQGFWPGDDLVCSIDFNDREMWRLIGVVVAVLAGVGALIVGHLVAQGAHVYAETGVGNVAIQTCLERAGFERIGERRVRLPNDTEVDGLIYARYATAAQASTLPGEAADGPADG